MSAPLRVLVIGAGPTTNLLHLPVLAALRDRGAVRLSLICDLQPERAEAARRTFGFSEACGDADAALARSDIDAVYVFGDARLHHQVGLRALECGKHLFIEKPITPSYALAHELAVTAHAQGLIAVGGHNRRFCTRLQKARAGAGRSSWRFAEAAFHKPELGRPPPFGARTWLTANGIHALDALVFMMGGLPEEVFSVARSVGAAPPSCFSAVMRWPNGAQGVFVCDNNASVRHEAYRFHGLGETITIDDPAAARPPNGTAKNFEAGDDGFFAEHLAFIEAIRTGRQPLHALALLAPSLFLAELIENGFSGHVQLPKAKPLPPPAIRRTTGGAVLVCGAAALQPALGKGLGGHSVLSLVDVMASSPSRSDVRAAILGQGSGPLPEAALDKLPNLAVVGVMGLSLARFEPQVLLARGIALVNASDAYADSVAEFALGLAILGRRRAFQSHVLMREGGWGVAPQPRNLGHLIRRMAAPLRPQVKALGLEGAFIDAWSKARPILDGAVVSPMIAADLKGARVGLIGWGANARAFTDRLVQAGVQVLVYSERATKDDIASARAIPAALAEVLVSDIVSLHRGLTPQTLHSFGASELARLRPGAVLINVARGALIEPNALLRRLQRRDIFACLDTFDDEPLNAKHPLRRLPNVFLTSHIAGGSPQMHAAAAEEVVAKVVRYLEGDSAGAIAADRLRTMT